MATGSRGRCSRLGCHSHPMVVGEPPIRAYLGVPLMTPDGHAVSALCAIDPVPRQFTPAQVDVLAGFARLAVDELEMRQIAASDQLTGSLSRRGFLAAVEREIARRHCYERSVSLAVLDIDHFKRDNDSYGHPAGDAVLRPLVARCMQALRPVDLVWRLDGEEFAILLPETDGPAAATIERLRASIASEAFDIGGAEPLRVTASFGLTALAPYRYAEAWLKRIDLALYAAKRGGRNRVEIVSVEPAAEAA